MKDKEIKEAIDRLESEIDNTVDLLAKTDSEFLYNALNELIMECNSLKEYLNHVFYELTKLSKLIEFSKDKRGTINGFVKHSIPDEVPENLMPWSEACKTACLPKMV